MSSLHKEITKYATKRGWKLHVPRRIRGRLPDLAFSENSKLGLVEIKGERANVDSAIEQALHFKNAADFSYLAFPKKAITPKLKQLCSSLGIGLLEVDGQVKEIVAPVESKALNSIKERFRIPIVSKGPQIKKKSSLERLFRSKTLILILKLLFLNSTREFHLNAISDMIGVSASTVYKELDNVYPLGLVTRTKKGSMVFYKINKDSIAYEDLRKLFLKFELADELITQELQKYPIKYALIYGSFAKGTETEASDIDLLVVGNISSELIYGSVSKLETKIGREINVTAWTEDEFNQKVKEKIALLQNIAKNPIIMVKGDEKEFTRLVR
jgi:predicted nucleotidyltransferase